MGSSVPWFLAACLAIASPASAHDGWGIASTPAGIFFTDIPRNIVWRLHRDGTLAVARERTHSHALVTIGDGSVYGTDVDVSEPIGSVWRIDDGGAGHTVMPYTRDLALALQSFLIDTDGAIYSAIRWAPDGRVTLLRRRPDGIIERVASGFSSIVGMAWAPDGAILLTDVAQLKRVTLAGNVETLGGGPLTEASEGAGLMGVTTDGSGGAFVADFARGRILDVGRHAGVAVEHASNFPWSPTGIARDGDGLVVLEHLRMPWSALGGAQIGPYLRVRRLGTDGRVQTLVVLWGTRTWMVAAGIAMAAGAALAWRLGSTHWRTISRRSN